MVTLNDLQRDFPEAYMNFRRANSISDHISGIPNDDREPSDFTKPGAITEDVLNANKNEGTEGFDK